MKNNKSVTAVEWLADKIDDLINDGLRERLDLLKEEAKEIERKQIVDAYKKGIMDITGDESNGIDAEQHYNETYKGGDNER